MKIEKDDRTYLVKYQGSKDTVALMDKVYEMAKSSLSDTDEPTTRFQPHCYYHKGEGYISFLIDDKSSYWDFVTLKPQKKYLRVTVYLSQVLEQTYEQLSGFEYTHKHSPPPKDYYEVYDLSIYREDISDPEKSAHLELLLRQSYESVWEEYQSVQ